ncbi:MAG: NAD(P)-binding domain-containing protein, partial [Alphaproteobacteria bacterium]|nr:NAD(P)-binding domain-containing protein [Alphaproteobacteria bacterium]
MTNHSETDKKPICGFIGLGAMGLGMAKNIRANFYDLVVMGRKNRAPVDLLLKMGATEVKTPMMMAERCDVIILCVTGSSEVSDILSGKDGIFAARRRPDQLPLRIIDCSTSD